MDTWLFVRLIFIGLSIFLAFTIWLDWIFKCRRSAKENEFKNYVTGFLVFGLEDAENEIFIFDGILGLNETQLVFANSFQNEAVYMANDISKICGFVSGYYDEAEFLEYVSKYLSGVNEKAIYASRSMAGISVTKKLPKKLKNEWFAELVRLTVGAVTSFIKKRQKIRKLLRKYKNICSLFGKPHSLRRDNRVQYLHCFIPDELTIN